MLQTLFTIPEQIGGIPIFGVGLLLALWSMLSCGILWAMVRKHGWNEESKGFVPFMILVAAAIAFLLPRVSLPGYGLPIRGYGLMLMLATIAGVALATYRARQVGLAAEVIFSLAFHMFIGGILGARLFYIIQYWDRIHVPGNLMDTLANIVNFVEGGLVVYGSLIGALVAGLWFVRKQKLPPLAIGDLIAPSLALGLAIGRIGCLMNGCCFGGVCAHGWAIQFPDRSPPELHQTPPYYDQHSSGLLYGFTIGGHDAASPYVANVVPGGAAEAVNLPNGARIQSVNGQRTDNVEQARVTLATADHDLLLETDKGSFRWSIGALPTRTLPVHPTQIYSAINAAILSLLTLSFFPFRRRDGEVFTLLIGGYAITRFLLEMIRTDEGGLWSTGLTISQNVSCVMLAFAVLLYVYLAQQPHASFWPTASENCGT